MSEPYDDFDEEWDSDDEWCPTCNGMGCYGADDDASARGFDMFACPDCDRGANSCYPLEDDCRGKIFFPTDEEDIA